MLPASAATAQCPCCQPNAQPLALRLSEDHAHLALHIWFDIFVDKAELNKGIPAATGCTSVLALRACRWQKHGRVFRLDGDEKVTNHYSMRVYLLRCVRTVRSTACWSGQVAGSHLIKSHVVNHRPACAGNAATGCMAFLAQIILHAGELCNGKRKCSADASWGCSANTIIPGAKTRPGAVV